MTDQNDNNSANANVEPNKPKSKGRPKGSKDQLGLPLKKRMKALRTIIEDPNSREADKVMAVKTMTELLADKIQTAESSKDLYMIKFEEIGKNDEIANEIPPANDNKPANEMPSNEGKENAKMTEGVGNKDIVKNKMISRVEDVMLNSKSTEHTERLVHSERSIQTERSTNTTTTPANNTDDIFTEL